MLSQVIAGKSMLETGKFEVLHRESGRRTLLSGDELKSRVTSLPFNLVHDTDELIE